MKDVINIIIGKEDITVLNQYTSENKEVFEQYLDIVKEMISVSKIAYKKGLSLEKLIELVQMFFEEYNHNVILIGYYKNETSKEEMKIEIKNMLQRILTKLNSSISLEEENIEDLFSNVSGVEENKSLRLSNGHPTGTETGYVSPIILAILTTVVQLTTLLYIFSQAME